MISTYQPSSTSCPPCLPGTRYRNGETCVDESAVAEDERVSNNERTMLLIKQIGNDIHPSIQLEVDYPSKHQDQKLQCTYPRLKDVVRNKRKRK